MRIRLLAPLLLAFIASTFAAVPSSTYFVENEGQWQGDFRFRAAIPGGSAFVSETGLVLDLQRRAEGGGMRDEGIGFPLPDLIRDHGGVRGGGSVQGHVLCLTFLSANPCPGMRGQDKLPSYSNYFLGRDSSRWKSRVGHYQRILADEVWPGINVEYVLKPEGVELLYHLQAGADPAAIQLQIEGLSSPLTLDATGNLRLPTSLGPLTEHAPTAFQAGGAIPCRYRLTSDSTYTFTLDGYDPQQALTIDPLLYSTFFGGDGPDDLNDLAIDPADGTLLLGGTTVSSDFPVVPGAYQDSTAGSGDLFISRFAADGRTLHFSTYLGGSGFEWRCGLLLEPTSICGYSCITQSPNWPLTPSAPDTSFNGSSEGAFWRLSTDGTALLLSSYWGGAGQDYIEGIGRDRDGRIYLAGRTRSTDLITTATALYPYYQGTEPAYISVFDSTGNTLLYSTFFPGAAAVYVGTMTVVAPFRVWLSGGATGVVITPDALQPANGSEFFSLLDLAGSTVIYSSYFGGSGSVGIMGLFPLDSNRILLTGRSFNALDFPVTPGAYDTAHAGVKAFVTRLELPATITHSTLLGSPTGTGETSMTTAAAFDPATGQVWIGGLTHSPDYPCTADAVDTVFDDPAGEEYGDGFITCLSPQLDSLVFSSYLGGSDRDIVMGLALESSDRLWIGGSTDSWDFPVTSNAYQPQTSGWGDVFLSLLILPEDTSNASPPLSLPPSSFRLSASPNPFNSTTQIRYALPQAGHVSLRVFDLLGREVAVLVNDVVIAGEHRVVLEGRELASGIYFVRLENGEMSATRKVLLVR